MRNCEENLKNFKEIYEKTCGNFEENLRKFRSLGSCGENFKKLSVWTKKKKKKKPENIGDNLKSMRNKCEKTAVNLRKAARKCEKSWKKI